MGREISSKENFTTSDRTASHHLTDANTTTGPNTRARPDENIKAEPKSTVKTTPTDNPSALSPKIEEKIEAST